MKVKYELCDGCRAIVPKPGAQCANPRCLAKTTTPGWVEEGDEGQEFDVLPPKENA